LRASVAGLADRDLWSLAVGVGHKPIAIPEMIGTRACGLDWKAPHGVTQRFQVTMHKGDPPSRACNLLSKNRCRAPLGDESSPNGPQVARIFKAAMPARDRERLTWATACPNRSSVGPSGTAQREGPATDTSEEVTLLVATQVIGVNGGDTARVNLAWRDDPCGDEVPEPLDIIRVILIVVGSHISLD
jgi:hypothetical protein